MTDATDPQSDALDDARDLDVMLGLAERELRFLIAHFDAIAEIGNSQSGAEFLEMLEVSLVALTRVRSERAALAGPNTEHQDLHDAITAMKRDQT